MELPPRLRRTLLEARWDSEAEFDSDAFVAINAAAFFVGGQSP